MALGCAKAKTTSRSKAITAKQAPTLELILFLASCAVGLFIASVKPALRALDGWALVDQWDTSTKPKINLDPTKTSLPSQLKPVHEYQKWRPDRARIADRTRDEQGQEGRRRRLGNSRQRRLRPISKVARRLTPSTLPFLKRW